MKPNELDLKRYLLGDLDESAASEIDLWVIAENESSDVLLAAEHALIEDYLEHALSTDDEKRFRSYFLVSTERQLQLDEISLIKHWAAATDARDAGRSTYESPPDFFSRIFRFSRPLTAAFAVLLIAVVTFIVWYSLSPTRTPLEIEYAGLNRSDLDLGDPRFSKVQLASGTMRDAGTGASIAPGSMTESVMFRLALPYNPGALYNPRVELVRDGRTAFTVESGRIYSTAAGNEVRVLVPKSLLTKGRLQLNLSDNGKRDTALSYSFTVE